MWIHLFKRQDFSVVMAAAKGDIRIVSSNARSALNENGGRVTMGSDVDYLKESPAYPSRYRPCIYYANIKK
jgi:hypothetical protein